MNVGMFSNLKASHEASVECMKNGAYKFGSCMYLGTGGDMEGGGTVDVSSENKDLIVQEFILHDNYPNPFNPSTHISYSIPIGSPVSIYIFDVNGGEVIQLFNDYIHSGTHSIHWNGKNEKGIEVSAGVYFYSIDVGESRQTKKMVLLK